MRRLFEYYRQFEELSPEENSSRLKARRDEERAKDLAITPRLDLTRLDWHEPPDAEIINAATFALRRSLNRYPEAAGGAAREVVAARHGLAEERVVLGHGAAQLLQAAVRRLAAGGRVLIPWPSWTALPALVARTGAQAVPVPCPAGCDVERVLAEAGRGTRAVLLASPNDPTGALLDEQTVRVLSERLPEATLLLDEALVDFAGEDRSLVALTDELPNLLVFRSFSKAWALAGLRAGYAVGPVGSEDVLSELGPGLGVAAPAQAAITTALEPGGRSLTRLARRVRDLEAQRDRLLRALSATGFRAAPAAAHTIWLAHRELSGPDIAHGLGERRIAVAPGADWGDERHVRITLRDRPATDRLASALRALEDG